MICEVALRQVSSGFWAVLRATQDDMPGLEPETVMIDASAGPCFTNFYPAILQPMRFGCVQTEQLIGIQFLANGRSQ